MLYPKEFILPTTNDPVSLLFYLFIGCTNDNLDTNYVRELAIDFFRLKIVGVFLLSSYMASYMFLFLESHSKKV
jgi:hypothetical protein